MTSKRDSAVVGPAASSDSSNSKEDDQLWFPVYAVRDFRAVKFKEEGKLVFIVVSLFICLLRLLETENREVDYLWIWLIGFVYWTLIEFLLAVRGVRRGDVTRGTLFGRKIGVLTSAGIRGAAEGSAITIFGLSVADMIIMAEVTGYGVAGVLLQLMFLLWTAEGFKAKRELEGVTSRRPLFRPAAVIVFSAMSAFTAHYFFACANAIEQERMLWMLFTLSLWAYIWHFVAYFCNVRWFEWTPKNPGNLWTQAIGFTFDSVIEIGLAYVFFVAVYFAVF